MDDILGLVASYGVGGLFTTAFVFGFFPTFVVNVLVLVYPRDHPRRRELLAELESVPRRQRPVWIAEQLATVLFDGVPVRVKDVRARRIRRRTDKEVSPKSPRALLDENLHEDYGVDDGRDLVIEQQLDELSVPEPGPNWAGQPELTVVSASVTDDGSVIEESRFIVGPTRQG